MKPTLSLATRKERAAVGNRGGVTGWLLAFSVPLLCACGGSTATPSDGGELDGPRMDVTVVDASDAGAPVDAVGEASLPDAWRFDAGDASLLGNISFSQTPGGGGEFFAEFYEGPTSPLPSCTTGIFGPCSTYVCPKGNVLPDAGPTTPFPTAGTLTIQTTTLGTVQVPSSGGYYQYTPNGPLFTPGDTLGVAASGADVPAFPMQPIAAPGLPTLVAPYINPDGGTVTIPSTQDLTVRWTGGQSGAKFAVQADSNFSSPGYAQLFCFWDAPLGQGVVPKAALAQVAGGAGTFFWYQTLDSTFDAGAWSISLEALSGTGQAATYP